MDIARCFYHIYTHTIAWAVKGKEQAKELIGKETFENAFDTLMQHANYNETNGINCWSRDLSNICRSYIATY